MSLVDGTCKFTAMNRNILSLNVLLYRATKCYPDAENMSQNGCKCWDYRPRQAKRFFYLHIVCWFANDIVAARFT
jgi:hypothetical protein